MAVGNALVTTAKFKPLTIAEWAAPLKEYAEQHQAAEEALIDLSNKASEYERYVRENPNSDIARQYNNYIGEIERQANALAQYGINPQSRADLTTLRRGYKTKIQPVQDVVERYREDEKAVRELRSKGIGYIGRDLNIDDYFENPDYHYSYILGSNVAEDFSKAFTALAASTATSPEFQKASNNSQYWQVMTSQGYSQADILNAVINNPELAPEVYNAIPAELRDTTTKLRAKYNYDNLSAEEQQAFDTYAYQGALSGIKQTSYSLQQNRGYETPSVALQTKKYLEAEKQKNRIVKQENRDENGNIIGSYYTFNGDLVENIGTEDNPKWIYYGTSSAENPNGIPIGYKAPTYKADATMQKTKEHYDEWINNLPSNTIYSSDGDGFSALESDKSVPTKGATIYDASSPISMDMLQSIGLSDNTSSLVEQAVREGKRKAVIKDGELYLTR